jgi:hypothetical protein
MALPAHRNVPSCTHSPPNPPQPCFLPPHNRRQEHMMDILPWRLPPYIAHTLEGLTLYLRHLTSFKKSQTFTVAERVTELIADSCFVVQFLSILKTPVGHPWPPPIQHLALSVASCCRSPRCRPIPANVFGLKSLSFPLNSKHKALRPRRRTPQLPPPVLPPTLAIPLLQNAAAQLHRRLPAKLQAPKPRRRNRPTRACTRCPPPPKKAQHLPVLCRACLQNAR